MQYKPETQKVAMMSNSYMPVFQPVSLATDSQVQRTRKILIIILGVCLALSVVSLVGVLYESGIGNHTEGIRLGTQLSPAIIAILFYGFGLFVAHRYSEIGLRVFAWLSVIVLVTTGIVLLLVTLIIIAFASTGSHGSGGHMGGLIYIVVGGFVITGISLTIAFILVAVIVKLAFKLARLIEANKRISIQQI